MFPLRVYLAVAAAIAFAAFGMAQIAPGLGAVFAALTSTLWTAYSVSHGRRIGYSYLIGLEDARRQLVVSGQTVSGET